MSALVAFSWRCKQSSTLTKRMFVKCYTKTNWCISCMRIGSKNAYCGTERALFFDWRGVFRVHHQQRVELAEGMFAGDGSEDFPYESEIRWQNKQWVEVGWESQQASISPSEMNTMLICLFSSMVLFTKRISPTNYYISFCRFFDSFWQKKSRRCPTPHS